MSTMAEPLQNSFGAAPSSFKFEHSSPLDTLVRRTSKKRVNLTPTTQDFAVSYHEQQPIAYNEYNLALTSVSQHSGAVHSERGLQITPPRQTQQRLGKQLEPNSPLLHSHFSRNSTATSSSNDNMSYLDPARSSIDSRNAYQEDLDYHYYDDESIYSQVTDHTPPALRDSWRSAATFDTMRPTNILANLDETNSLRSVTPNASQTVFAHPPSPSSVVPTLVISSPGPEENYASRSGRTPVVKPITSNFSRPMRLQQQSTPSFEKPPRPVDDGEQKRRVLERNARRAPSPNLFHSEPPSFVNLISNQTLNMPAIDSRSKSTASSTVIAPSKQSPSPPTLINDRSVATRSKSPNPANRSPLGLHSNPEPSILATHSSAPNPHGNNNSSSSNTSHSLLNAADRPSSRADSPVSLYSNYSYYQYDGLVPSPIGSQYNLPLTNSPQNMGQRHPSGTRPITPGSVSKPVAASGEVSGSTPLEYLQLGIQHHEANRLRESAICFEKSARENGGCGVGMLMWGLTLRHGWGCEKNEKVGFKWLRKAAESAVEDLESARGGGMDVGAVQNELVLAIYEVGQCFFQGWGVPKDQKMAVSYYLVAARLGDADAQTDLAFCLANGKGCKKDRKEAAKWYRAAVAQGQSDIGLAWIYKEKFQ